MRGSLSMKTNPEIGSVLGENQHLGFNYTKSKCQIHNDP